MSETDEYNYRDLSSSIISTTQDTQGAAVTKPAEPKRNIRAIGSSPLL